MSLVRSHPHLLPILPRAARKSCSQSIPYIFALKEHSNCRDQLAGKALGGMYFIILTLWFFGLVTCNLLDCGLRSIAFRLRAYTGASVSPVFPPSPTVTLIRRPKVI